MARIVLYTRKQDALPVSAPIYKAFTKGGESMDVINIPIGQLKPYEKNAKKHPKEQIEQIANSLKEFGWQQPIVIDDHGTVVIGHGRLAAAKKLKMKEVPVVYASGLTDEQIKALRLADNKTNESEWDFELLSDELDSIFDIDMSSFGFELSDGGGGKRRSVRR